MWPSTSQSPRPHVIVVWWLAFPISHFSAQWSPADLVSLSPVKDNTLYQHATGAVSNGAGSAMFAGRNSAELDSIRRAILAFDIASAIPAGSTIQNATLTLYNDAANVGPSNVGLHRLLIDWGEGASLATGGQGSGAPAAPGDATWQHNFYDTSHWSTPGGDFTQAASSVAGVAGAGFYAWPSTAQLVADVQSFFDSPADNFGWALIGDETIANTAKRFATREAASADARPILTVQYAPIPEPPAIALILFVVVPILFRWTPLSSHHTTPSRNKDKSPNRVEVPP